MAHDVERVLADIDADHDDCAVEFLRHGVLLDFGAPGASFACWRGPEHGQTIPLAVLVGIGIPSAAVSCFMEMCYRFGRRHGPRPPRFMISWPAARCSDETPRVHHAVRRRGGGVAAGSARAAGGAAGDNDGGDHS